MGDSSTYKKVIVILFLYTFCRWRNCPTMCIQTHNIQSDWLNNELQWLQNNVHSFLIAGKVKSTSYKSASSVVHFYTFLHNYEVYISWKKLSVWKSFEFTFVNTIMKSSATAVMFSTHTRCNGCKLCLSTDVRLLSLTILSYLYYRSILSYRCYATTNWFTTTAAGTFWIVTGLEYLHI